MSRPLATPRAHPDALLAYMAIGLAWLATRLFAGASVDLTPWMLNDLDIYQSWLPSLSNGAFPATDPTWQYPPGAALVFLASGHRGMDFRWSFTLVILAIDAALMLTLIVAHARQAASSWRGLWLWALAGIIVGPIMMVRFDVAPTLFAVLAVVLAARPAWSGASAAIGTVIKVWPVLMLLSLPRLSLRRGVPAFVLTLTVTVLGFLLMFHDSLSFLANQRDRGLQVESSGALPYLVASLLGNNVAFTYTYGSVQVFMRGAETVGTIVTVVGFAVIAVIVWWRLRGRLESVPPGDVALTVMLVSVATSRVYSPQFNTWLIGVAAAALLSSRSRLGGATGLVVALSIVTQVVYPWSATQLVSGEASGIIPQVVRITLLVVATVLAVDRLAQAPRELAPEPTGAF
jgi:uncharacterized membrane protein